MFVHRDKSGRIIDVTGSVNRAELEVLLREQAEKDAEKSAKKAEKAEKAAAKKADAEEEGSAEPAPHPVYGETHPPEPTEQATKRRGRPAAREKGTG